MAKGKRQQTTPAGCTTMNETVHALISHWLQQRLSSDQWDWLQERLRAMTQSNSDKELYVALGMAPRKLGKSDLALNDSELAKAEATSTGWNPCDWSIDGAARVLTLLTLADKNPEEFKSRLQSLCATADVSEAIIYYRAMDLFPDSETFEDLIGEGLRTNMRAVFEAIAHNNPYPYKYFDDHRWNHMILKALFIDSSLYPIRGIDDRANADLAGILCNYAHERWAANRSITPELWRCVGPYATLDMLNDLERASQSGNANEHSGAMLALSQCPLPEAKPLVAAYPATANSIVTGELTWDTLALRLNPTKQRPEDQSI